MQNSTRVTETSQTIIDHCHANNAAEIDVKLLMSDISDHVVIIAMILDSFHAKNFARPMVRNFAKESTYKFLALLASKLDTYNLYESVNVNFEYLINAISELADYCFPLKKTSRKAYIRKPWITLGIRKSIQTPNKLLKEYLATQTNESSTEYNKNRNKLTHVKEMAKAMFNQNKFNDCKTDISATWRNSNINAEVTAKHCTTKNRVEIKSLQKPLRN